MICDHTYKCTKCGAMAPKKRSTRQNKAMFGLAYFMLAAAMSELQGETVTTKQVHEICKDKFKDVLNEYRIDSRFVEVKKAGGTKIYELPPSTAKLSTVGMMKYYRELQRFGSEWFDIYIPDPNERDFEYIRKAG